MVCEIGLEKEIGCCFIINVVMMGMGEFLFNMKNFILVLEIMFDDFGFGFFKCCVIVFIFGVVFGLE